MSELHEAHRNETQLVWNRFNAMIVVHSILMGSTATIVAASGNRADIYCLAISVLGIILSIIWFIITHAGWSLVHAYLEAAEAENKKEHPDVNTVYLEWKNKYCRSWTKDPIWWGAHSIIIIFGIVYLLILSVSLIKIFQGFIS